MGFYVEDGKIVIVTCESCGQGQLSNKKPERCWFCGWKPKVKKRKR